MSDYEKKLPGGNKYIHEGGCANHFLSNMPNVPDIISGVLDIKYNDSLISISYIDSSLCLQNRYSEKDKRYVIINVKKGTISVTLEKSDYDRLISNGKLPKSLKF